MIGINQKGDFEITTNWLKRMHSKEYLNKLDYFGEMGVQALADATPKKTGLTASLWKYRITKPVFGKTKIEWYNENVNKGVPIAIILQYGHGTGTGGYVEGIDYINPAMKPVFEEISKYIGEEVSK